MSKPTAIVRTAADVIRDVCSRNLPERTVTSGGQPADRDDPTVCRKLRKGEVHPYMPGRGRRVAAGEDLSAVGGSGAMIRRWPPEPVTVR